MYRSITRLISILLLATALPFTSHAKTTDKSVTTTETKSTTKVDVNTADAATLETLPGIGPVTAQAIIAARPFKSVNDLESVPGIGPSKMADLRGRVKASHVRTETAATKPAKSSRTERAATARADETRSTRVASTTREDRPITPTGRESMARSAGPAATGGLINLNTASQAELESLPEIGPVKARAIIEARPFKSKEDVMRVKGIKQATFEAIQDKITVR